MLYSKAEHSMKSAARQNDKTKHKTKESATMLIAVKNKNKIKKRYTKCTKNLLVLDTDQHGRKTRNSFSSFILNNTYS